MRSRNFTFILSCTICEAAIRWQLYKRQLPDWPGKFAPKEPFEASALLLDADRRRQEPERDARIEPLAQQNSLLLVWQRPCHEALLLHHLPNCQGLAPQNSSDAHFHLRRVWSVYQKPMSARQLRARIGLAELVQAATVESELADLLRLLGFL
jgi:hypothetical protein